MAHPGGRPTKYTPELVQKAWDYANGAWKEEGKLIPSNFGLMVYLRISKFTLNKWKNDEDKPEFSTILAEIQAKQGELLINKGLSGEFNSNICKLVLGKHGFHEQKRQEISGPGGNPIETKWTVEFIKAPPAVLELE